VERLRKTAREVSPMSPTVHEIRNGIRAATGRFEREVDATFTKEELQAICEALGIDGGEAERPSTTRMRRLIRAQVGIAASPETADDATFRKADLRAIADRLGASVES
jgi:hypothetical protein